MSSEDSISDFRIVEEPKKVLSMNPKKFALWLFLGSVVMLFASLTSAYIVRQAEGNWVYFELPVIFTVSTIVILISSVTMQLSFWAAKKDEQGKLKNGLIATTVLGVAFLVLQFYGWVDLVNSHIHLVGNPSGSFLYIITGLHGLHILSALIFLLMVLAASMKSRVHPGNLLKLEMCTTYWHFLGGLWLYLFVFLLLYR
jgi:cytochrome c oxidase subunit III